MRVLIACGGTGGHIFPAISLAQELRKRGYSDIVFITDNKIKAKALIQKAGFNSFSVEAPKMPYGLGIGWFLFILKFIVSHFKTKDIIKKIAPDIAIGFGAYISGPAISVAKTMGVKTLIHEQNYSLGRANRLLINKADKVCFSFKHSLLDKGKKYLLTGNPIRQEILKDFRELTKEAAILKLGLSSDKKTLLVIGGSKGSSAINSLMASIVTDLTGDEKRAIQLIHITGDNDFEYVSKVYKDNNIDCWIKNFYDRIGLLYKASDLAVCRSGAATISEISLFKIPAIFIPYPWAGRHQRENASIAADAGGAIILEENGLTADKLKQEIFNLLDDKTRIERMISAINSFAKPEAAKNLTDAVEDLIHDR